MKELRFISYSVSQTTDIARRLSRLLRKGDVIGLVGNLGLGKTTFIKGLAAGLGFRCPVNSPGFVILKMYSIKNSAGFTRSFDAVPRLLHSARMRRGGRPEGEPLGAHKIALYHFDLYRLKTLKDLEDIGYEDFVADSGICVIEWADRAKKLLPREHLVVTMQVKGQQIRAIRLIGYGRRYERLLRTLSKRLPRSGIAPTPRRNVGGRGSDLRRSVGTPN